MWTVVARDASRGHTPDLMDLGGCVMIRGSAKPENVASRSKVGLSLRAVDGKKLERWSMGKGKGCRSRYTTSSFAQPWSTWPLNVSTQLLA